MIHLAGSHTPGRPDKVEGIPVGQAFATLYVLHAADTTATYAATGTVIGKYLVRYRDKTTATIAIVFGKDVRGWWFWPNSPPVTGGRVVWTGHNAASKEHGAGVRLYMMTWKNPHPQKKVAAIDFVSTKTSRAAPFCVAMTVKGK
jgi:hypothetical protein